MKGQTKGKVFVGMSGGVDSSVSAALLKEQGFDVTGVFIKVWQPDWFECTWREDRLDAMRVAVELGIPFMTIDLEKEYKKEVVDFMISEYRAGRTPNPDIMCNQYVKFGGFFEWAMKNGADFVATGHYAQIKDGKLLSGIDSGKDQSYFLWTLSDRQISKTLFPVGGMEKTKTRRLAHTFRLPVAEKRDSQGLCFIGKVNIKEFLSHYIAPKAGKVLDESGKELGEHDGAFYLTLGERLGFAAIHKSADEKPYFIVDRNIEANTVTVSHKAPDGSLSAEKTIYNLGRTNWIVKPFEGKKCFARVRHLGELLPCIIESIQGKEARIIFNKPLIVASGQSVVVYEDASCIGGGIVV